MPNECLLKEINQADLQKNALHSAEKSYVATAEHHSDESREKAVYAGYAESMTKPPITAIFGR